MGGWMNRSGYPLTVGLSQGFRRRLVYALAEMGVLQAGPRGSGCPL